MTATNRGAGAKISRKGVVTVSPYAWSQRAHYVRAVLDTDEMGLVFGEVPMPFETFDAEGNSLGTVWCIPHGKEEELLFFDTEEEARAVMTAVP